MSAFCCPLTIIMKKMDGFKSQTMLAGGQQMSEAAVFKYKSDEIILQQGDTDKNLY